MKEVYFDDFKNDAILVKDENIIFEKIIKNFDSFNKAYSGGANLSLWENGVKVKNLRIGTDEKLGICLTYDIVREKEVKGKKIPDDITFLAVYDKARLDKVIDIYDELYVSEGLLLPKEIAWKGISEFIRTGGKSSEIEWITPEMIPEEGNWC